jgi:hypothetical protein
MTIRSKALLAFGALMTSALAICAAPNPNSTLYSVDEDFVATGVDANARGHVSAKVKHKGNVQSQRIRLTVAQLDPNTPYTLLASMGEDSDPVAVADFNTTSSGRAVLNQVQTRVLDKVRRVPKRRVLADALNPLLDVRSLAVVNTNGEVVLTVDLHNAPSLHFELTSVLASTGNDPAAIGCLAVAWQSGYLQFRLFAAGQSSQYTFSVNDAPVGTYLADYTGRISVGVFPPAAPSPLTFRKLSLRNADDIVVLESQLP